MEATTLASQLGLATLRLSRRLRQQTVEDISASQLSALSTLDKHGEASLGELATIERVAPPSMTRIAARLEEDGLVERRVDASDRRVALVALTPAGRRLLDDIRTRRDAFLAVRLRAFSDDQCRILRDAVALLERLASEDH